MQTIKSFIRKNKIRMGCGYAAHNPPMEETPNHPMTHHRCVLRMKRDGHNCQMTVTFSQGSAYGGSDPEIEGVLNCLASDSSSVDNSQGFEDWARDLGYDTDSRKAEKIFKACERQREKLIRFLGDDLYQELLYKCEQL
jgi:hypothetical protein